MKSALVLFLFPLFFIGVFGDVESVSVMVGDSITLHTGVTEIQTDEVIDWRFGQDSIARINRGTSKSIIRVKTDGPFKDRLQLDNQTGNLKIMNIRNSDSGLYLLEISRTETSSKTFNLIVPADPVKTVSVMDGDSVTLNTELQRCDVIRWTFGPQHSLVAEINRKAGLFSTSDGPDGRFRDRLKLDDQTGSLTIKNIRTRHSGLYEVDISTSSSNHTIHKSFSVTVSGEIKSVLSVKEGYPVTLDTGLTEIQTDDSIHWMFGDTYIAEIYKAYNRSSFNDDERFRDRLKLDQKTGSLTITNTTITDSGDYKLKIISSRLTVYKRITVTVPGSGSGLSSSVPDPGLSSGSGSGLSSGAVVGIVGVILMAGAVAAGVIYHRHLISELKRQWPETLVVTEGESVTVKTDGTGIHKDDDIQWKFRGTLIAERKGLNGEITVHDDVHYGIFKDRFKLDQDSGSLTITNIRVTMSGCYELRIIRRGRESFMKTYTVSVFANVDKIEIESVKKGDPLTLSSGVTEIQRDDQIQWMFDHEDSPIAQIKGGTTETFPSAADGRFRDRLKLDQTGSLTIENIRPTDAGFYDLYNTKSGKSIKLFRVKVHNPKDVKKNPEETSEACRSNPEWMPLMDVNVSDT